MVVPRVRGVVVARVRALLYPWGERSRNQISEDVSQYLYCDCKLLGVLLWFRSVACWRCFRVVQNKPCWRGRASVGSEMLLGVVRSRLVIEWMDTCGDRGAHLRNVTRLPVGGR